MSCAKAGPHTLRVGVRWITHATELKSLHMAATVPRLEPCIGTGFSSRQEFGAGKRTAEQQQGLPKGCFKEIRFSWGPLTVK